MEPLVSRFLTASAAQVWEKVAIGTGYCTESLGRGARKMGPRAKSIGLGANGVRNELKRKTAPPSTHAALHSLQTSGADFGRSGEEVAQVDEDVELEACTVMEKSDEYGHSCRVKATAPPFVYGAYPGLKVERTTPTPDQQITGLSL